MTHNYQKNKDLIEFISDFKKAIKIVSNNVILYQGNSLKFESFDEKSYQLAIQGDKINQGFLQKTFENLQLNGSISKFSCDENFKFTLTGPFNFKKQKNTIHSSTNNENTEYASCYSSFWTEEKTALNLSLLSLAESYGIASKLDGDNYFFKGDNIEGFCSQLLDSQIPFDFAENGIIKISSLIIEEYERLGNNTGVEKSYFRG